MTHIPNGPNIIYNSTWSTDISKSPEGVIKAYLLKRAEQIRLFRDLIPFTSFDLLDTPNTVSINEVLGCVVISIYDFASIADLYPNLIITTSLQEYLEKHPDILNPIDLPEDSYWQSLLPDHLTLRPFQLEFLDWAEGRRQRAHPPNGTQRGVICSLDQGLGKTVVAIVWDQHLRMLDMCNNTVVICRSNNKYTTWVRHYEDLTNLDIVVIEGQKKKRVALWREFHRGEHDVAILNYETFRTHEDEVLNASLYIFDEAHKLANHKSKRSQLATIVASQQYPKGTPLSVLELTGGAAQNRVERQLWHPLHLLDQKEWPSFSNWKKRYCVVKEQIVPRYKNGKRMFNPYTRKPVYRTIYIITGLKNKDQLSLDIAPYMYQKSKWDVGEQLPPKIFQTLHTHLTKKQRDLYIDVRDDILTEINGVTIPIALTKTLRLLQLCATLDYFDLGDISQKADEASEIIYEEVPDGHKAIIFTQHVLLANAVHRRLEELQASVLLLTGKNPASATAKDEIRDEFQMGSSQFLVTMIQLEGEGSDYPMADYVYRLDRDHRPLVNIQCEDRAHRYTSTQPVNITDFVTRDSIEEVQIDILAAKLRDIEDVTDLAKVYTMADIKRMLAVTPKASY